MPIPEVYVWEENLISSDFGEDPPPLHYVPNDTPMLRGVPFELNKNDRYDQVHAAMHNKLNAYCERAIHERKENHFYQGPLMHLKKETEENLIKLHALIGKYNRLPDGEQRDEFFAALKVAQEKQNKEFEKLLIPHFWTLKIIVDVDKAWPPDLFAYKVLTRFEFDEHRTSREILRRSQELAAIDAANAAVDASMAAAAAAKSATESTTEVDEGATTAPVIATNENLRGKPNPYHPWVATGPAHMTETPRITPKKTSQKDDDDDENIGFFMRIAKAINDYFSRMRARKAASKESDEIELVDLQARTEVQSVHEDDNFRVMSHAEVAEQQPAVELSETQRERRNFWGGITEMPTRYRYMRLDVRPGRWRQPHPTDPTPDEDIDICRIGVIGLRRYVDEREALRAREALQSRRSCRHRGRGGRGDRGGPRGRGNRGQRGGRVLQSAETHDSREGSDLAPVAEAGDMESETSCPQP